MHDNPINAVVLVVDDSPESLGMLNLALSEKGFTVLLALSGPQAQSILEKVEPDVILMDAIMPQMDGFQACQLIKQSHPDLPVIFMTGLSDEDNIVKGFAVGGVDYITKPIKPSEVIARIQVHINNARLKASTREALDTTGKHILEIDHQAEVIWATQQAQQLYRILLNANGEESVKKRLQEWLVNDSERLPIVFRKQDKDLQMCFISSRQDKYLIQISERESSLATEKLTANLGMTQREAEVLLWLSQSKTNKEIAQILDISPRTVNKHLETIFRKLEVDNRTAAAAVCLRLTG